MLYSDERIYESKRHREDAQLSATCLTNSAHEVPEAHEFFWKQKRRDLVVVGGSLVSQLPAGRAQRQSIKGDAVDEFSDARIPDARVQRS